MRRPLSAVASTFSRLLRRSEQPRAGGEGAARQQAPADPLTGLPGREQFTQDLRAAMERARREKRKLLVLFIDIEGLGGLNERFGRPFGDGVLRAVALRLTDRLRSSDRVGRLGGDEFGAVLQNIESAERAERVSGQIAALLREPIYVEGQLVSIPVRMGRAIYPDDARTIDDLLAQAARL